MFNGNLKEKISNLQSRPKIVKVIIIILICLIALIYVFDLFETDKNENTTTQYGIDINNYKSELERSLMDALENISGVGKVKVMITFKSNQEIIYECESEYSSNNNGENKQYSQSNKTVMKDTGNTNDGLIKKINEPQINGVLVICDGASDVNVKTKVTEAVKKLFSISNARVCVTN